MYFYQTIASEHTNIKLVALQNEDMTIDKEFIWMEFADLKDKEYPSQELIFDYTPFLFDDFLPLLKKIVNREGGLTHDEIELLEDNYLYLKENGEDIIEMLEKALELKWY